MDGEITRLLNDCERLILLLRACQEPKETYLDELDKNIQEIRRIGVNDGV